MGLILLIRLLIKTLENSEITSANPNIGKSDIGSKEKDIPTDKDWLTSRLATNDITISSIEAIKKDKKHCTSEL